MTSSAKRALRAAALLVAALTCAPSSAHAQGSASGDVEKVACIDAHAQGQELRNAKKLTQAKERLLECSTRACPTPILRECASLLAEVMMELPTLALSVTLPGGEALTDASLFVDAKPWGGALGIALEIDPGVHEVRVTHPVHGEVKRVITVLEGKKAQSVVLEIGESAGPISQPEARPPAVESERSLVPPAGAFVFFGLSVAAFASGAALGILSLDLETSAASQEDLDELENLRLGADISLIGGGAFAVVGVIWWLVDATSAPEPVGATTGGAVTLDVHSLDGGVWLGLRVKH